MASGLEHLLDEGVISEVLARLQSGKEAEVFVVRYGEKVVAAKVYKDRAHRSFKNNASYKEGRTVRNSRSTRAMETGSKFGKAAAEDAWKSAEADALYRLHAAGVRVPTPVMFIDGVLLMELVLDADGKPASRLIDTTITPALAERAYHDMLAQLVRMLSCDLIHGDLSPYNVLWAATGPTLIDFPQIVSASQNGSSERFFLRDADNILGHFAEIDRGLRTRRGDAAEIWRAYVRRELSPDFVPSGKASLPPRAPARPAPRPHVDSSPGRDGQGSARLNGSSPRQGQQQGSPRQGQQQGSPRQQQGSPRQQQGSPRPQQGSPRPQQGSPRPQHGSPRPQQQGSPRQQQQGSPRQQQQGSPRQQQQGSPRQQQGSPRPQQQGSPRQQQGSPRPQQGRTADPRRAAKAPEVLFARPRRPVPGQVTPPRAAESAPRDDASGRSEAPAPRTAPGPGRRPR